MAGIKEFSDQFRAYNDRMTNAVNGISGDVAELKRKLEEMQNNPGPISGEDQALLDGALELASNLTTRLEEVDQMNAPAVPTEGEVASAAGSAQGRSSTGGQQP